MKSWLKSKTLWASLVVAVLGVVLPYLEVSDVPSEVLTGLGALYAYLRAVTKEPIGRKPKQPQSGPNGTEQPTPTGEA